MQPKEKDKIVSTALKNFSKKFMLRNKDKSATRFLTQDCEDSNIEIIHTISQNLSQLSTLTPEESSALKDVLDKHNLLPVQPKQCRKTSANRPTTTISDVLSIRDLSSNLQNISDEYDYILENRSMKRKRIYQVTCTEVLNSFTVQYVNYVFGHLCIESDDSSYNKEKLISILSRKNVVNALLDSFGFISEDSSVTCSLKEQDDMFKKFSQLQSPASVNRQDGSTITILKVGTLSVSYPNKISEKLDQYLICSNSKLYLVYGRIDFSLIETSNEYRYNLANILLSYEQLNKSRYVGSLVGNTIIKSPIPFGGRAVTSKFKTSLKVAL